MENRLSLLGTAKRSRKPAEEMVKHRLRESIKSLFRSHIDPEKQEQLKGAKREIQDKVKRILKLVKDEHLEEDGTPLELSKRESLVKLIEDFQNQYQSLHAKYDHLTIELRKKITGKQEQGSFSSSSDSDSDYSSMDKDSKNGLLENEFQRIINGMKQELDMAHAEVAELDRKLTITSEEKEDLNSRYLAALNKIQADDKIIMEDLKRENDNLILEKETAFLQIAQQKDEKIAVQKELEAVTGELSFLKQRLEDAELQMTNLSHNLKVAEDENESLKFRLLRLSNEVQMADNRTGERIAESNQLREELHDRESQVSELTRRHEEYENATSNHIKALECQVTNLKLELESLQSLKRDQITDLQQVKTLQHQKSELEVQLDGKVLENSEHVIQIQALKNELEEKEYEITTLLENVRILEVKLRLSNQKLRVTEQLLSEHGESFRETVEKFQKDQQSLEDSIATLSATIAGKDDAYEEIVTDIKESLNNVTSGIENVVCKFSDEYKNYENCISNISHELQIAKNYIREMNKEKERSKKEIQHLMEQLQDKDEEELVLRKMIENLEEKANKEESEKRNLTTTVVQLQKTVAELEKLVKEKDEGILDMGEEKREAIRQLCLGIDYHRSRYDYLKDVLSVTRRDQRA